MILAGAASLPLGMKLSGNALTISQTPSAPLVEWDFEGLEVALECDVTLVRPRFHNTVNAHFLHVGEAGHGPTVSIIQGDFDPSGLNADAGEGAVALASGTLLTSATNWGDAARDFVSMFGGSWVASGDRFGLAGLDCGPGSHVDGVGHIYGGNVLLDGCLIDARLHGRQAPKCGWTGLLYGQAVNSPVNIEIRNTPILGAVDLGLLYPIQTNARAYPVSVDLRCNAIELGVHGGLVGDTPAAGGKVRLTGAYNINAATGRPLPVAA